MTSVPQAITTFYAAACRGDRQAAESAVAVDFGIQDGKTRQAWIDHELNEFAIRREAVGLSTLKFSDAASPGFPGSRQFAILTEEGDLLFEEALRLDHDGKIAGNGRKFEIVTKLLFTRGQQTRRAMAIRAPGGEVVAAIPDFPGARDIRLSPGMNFDNDRFTTLSFVVEDDDLAGRECGVYIKGRAGPGVKEMVYLRGVDSPRFTYLAEPVIREQFIDLSPLAGGLPLWSVTAGLVDGSAACIEHPSFDVVTCSADVRTLVITDALDNDWAWSSP